MTMRQMTETLHPGPSARRFSLNELVLLVTFSAIAFAFAANGVAMLGIFFLLTIIAFRTSIVDYSIVGDLAALLTMVFGTCCIGLFIFWSAGW